MRPTPHPRGGLGGDSEEKYKEEEYKEEEEQLIPVDILALLTERPSTYQRPWQWNSHLTVMMMIANCGP